MLGLAQTGTGKTAAFALPILERLLAGSSAGSPGKARDRVREAPAPRALVVAPTRELAAQIQAEFTRLARFTTLSTVTIFGGVPAGPQVRALRALPAIVVACPGRLLDLLQQRALSLGAVETLVLDEADHMFDMGFLPSLRRILAALPRRRQNLMFSATMPREVRHLADEVLGSPHVVELAHDRPPESIEHALLEVDEGGKAALLQRLLAAPDFRSAIVFLRTKRRAQRVAEHLVRLGRRAVALQGNLSQSQRERAMGGFRAGRFDVLVATDIAARGIDVAQISHVVNYDLPTTPEAYTHRIGRTGRSGEAGRAYSFVTPADAACVRAIERHLGSRIPIERSHAGSEPVHRPLAARVERDGGFQRKSAAQRTRRRPAAAAAAPLPAKKHAAASRRTDTASSAPFGGGLQRASRTDPGKARRRKR